MVNKVSVRGREGFTLIEVLVTLILLAVLAAAVFPVVTQQAEQGDPVKAAQDLSSIRSGIETFQLNVRPSFPGDLEDLVYQISNAQDAPVNTTTLASGYSTTQVNKWDGPYVDIAVAQAGLATGTALETGFGGIVENDLTCYNGSANTDAGITCQQGRDFVAVEITGLSDAQYEEINDLIDGENEADATDHDTGKLRFIDLGGVADVLDSNESVYYLAVPYR